MTLDSSGDLYGATQTGGMFGSGTVFELTSLANGSWSLSTLYGFVGAGVGGSYRTITMDNAGNLYGTSSGGGAYRWGSVFKLTWSNGGWVYRSLHDFTGGADGGTPFGSLVLDASGNLYGTTFFGGTGQCNAQGYTGCGVVFEMTP